MPTSRQLRDKNKILIYSSKVEVCVKKSVLKSMKIIAPCNQIIYLFGLQVCLIMRVHFFKLRLQMGRSTDVKTPATTLTCNCFGRGAHPNGLPPLWSPQLFCVPIQSIGFKLTCCQCTMYTTCCVWPTNSGRVVAQQL